MAVDFFTFRCYNKHNRSTNQKFTNGGIKIIMKEKGRKIAGLIIAASGALQFIIGISEKMRSMIIVGICLCISGCLYLFGKKA